MTKKTVLLTDEQVAAWKDEAIRLEAEIASARQRLRKVRRKLAAAAELIDHQQKNDLLSSSADENPQPPSMATDRLEEGESHHLGESAIRMGQIGGRARAQKLSSARRREIAVAAARARWGSRT